MMQLDLFRTHLEAEYAAFALGSTEILGISVIVGLYYHDVEQTGVEGRNLIRKKDPGQW